MGSHSYLQNMYDRTSAAHAGEPSYLQLYSVPHLQQQYSVPHLQQMYRVPHLQEQYAMHLTRAQADAIEARADKGDADLHLKLDASSKLPAALVTKLESAADAIDQKLHTFVEAHVVADPALQQMYCSYTNQAGCYWVNIKW